MPTAKRKSKRNNSRRDNDVIEDNIPRGAGGRRHIIVPALHEPDAYRFTSKIREGRLSGEVFCKNTNRRRELGLPVIYPET